MAKRRHRVPSSKARPRRKGRSSRGDGTDLDDGSRVGEDDLFPQGLGPDYLDSSDPLMAWHLKLFSSLRKNCSYWIILVCTVTASLTWLTYLILISTSMVKGLASVPLFKSDAIAFYHPAHKSYVACVERPPPPKPGMITNHPSPTSKFRRKPRYRVKESLDVFDAPSSDSDLIALIEPGDTITVLERRQDWIRHARGLVVEGWSKLERRARAKDHHQQQQPKESSPANTKEDGATANAEGNGGPKRRNITKSLSRTQIEKIREEEDLLHFDCYCAAGSKRGPSKVASPYYLSLGKDEIPSEDIWRIPLFAQSALYHRARLMGTGHGCLWCSDALLLGLSPVIWTFVNLPLGLLISFGTLVTDLVSLEVGETWSLVVLCSGTVWFCLCLLATYALELRANNYDLANEQRWWLQLQFLSRPLFDLVILSVGIFLVGPCLAIPIYIFLLIRFYSIPSHKTPGDHPGTPTEERGNMPSMEKIARAEIAKATANFSGESADDDSVQRDDTQVIYTCSLLRDRFLNDHVVMSAIYVCTCLASHAFGAWRLFPDVRWIAVPQLYQFYCILKRGTPDGYVVICFAWQCLGVALALRTGGLVSYVVYVVFCKDFDHPKPHMPWREYTHKQIIALGCFSLGCGAVGVIPALLMFLTTLAKNPKAYLSANREEIAAARKAKARKGKKAKINSSDVAGTGGLVGGSTMKDTPPDYCRVIADFLVKLGLVLMARALVGEFRCSKWLDYNLANFLSYVVDFEIDNRAHMSLLTILGGGVATSIARRNWIPNLCSYAAGGRTALEIITLHKHSSYVAQPLNDKNGSRRKDSKSKDEGHTVARGKDKTSARSRLVEQVERFMRNPSTQMTAFIVICSVALISGVPVMLLLPLIRPDPWEQMLGPGIWTLAVFMCSILPAAPQGVLAAADITVLAFGFLAWALKDYDESDFEDDLVPSPVPPLAGKMSVTQKLKIGLEGRAMLGDVRAQFQMANLYVREGDHLKAADWWRQAANHGNKEAQLAIAKCYEAGKGVPRDEKMSVYWYEKAAEQGSAEAKLKVARIGVHGLNPPTDAAQKDPPREGKNAEDAKGRLENKELNKDDKTKPEPLPEPRPAQEMLPPEKGKENSNRNFSVPSSMIHRGIFSLEIGTTFWGFISHSKLWRMPVKVEGKICAGIYPNFLGEWTAVGKVTCESQAIFINIKAYGVVILGDRTTQAHLVFVTDGRMEGEVFQEGVSGGSAVLEVQFPSDQDA